MGGSGQGNWLENLILKLGEENLLVYHIQSPILGTISKMDRRSLAGYSPWGQRESDMT